MRVPGPCTGQDLGNMTALSVSWRSVSGLLRPVYSQEAAALSLELAAAAYSRETAPWQQAGWQDICFLSNQKIYRCAPGEEEGQARQPALRREGKINYRQVPVSSAGTLRRRKNAPCSCLIMAHRTTPGHYIIALGFMGTGKRLTEWQANFRMGSDGGAHQGFRETADVFEASLPLIQFPETARELSLEALTLADILSECARPRSRFRLWMAGHSLGSAVMQLTALRALRRGMLRQHLIGYGFASPSVLYQPPSPAFPLESCPLFHLLNGDDTVPRVGASLHVGRCLVYQPDEALRLACYGGKWRDPAFRAAHSFLSQIRDNRTCSQAILALLHTVASLPEDERLTAVSAFLRDSMPRSLLNAFSGKLDQLIQAAIRKAEDGYAALYREPYAGSAGSEWMRRAMAACVARFGAAAMVRAILQALGTPHALRSRDPEKPTVYQTMARLGAASLRTYETAENAPRFPAQPLRTRSEPPRSRFSRRPPRHSRFIHFAHNERSSL